MLTDYQKDKIARKLWIEYLQCALRDGAAQCDMRDVQDVLKQTYALANMEHKKQFRRRPKLRAMSWREILGVSNAQNPQNSQNPAESSNSADIADSAHEEDESAEMEHTKQFRRRPKLRVVQ